MRTLLAVSGLLMASAVAAKPLPAGLKVVAKDGRPYIQQGKTLVPLRDDEAADYEKILKAELTADGKTVEVTADRCAGAAPGDVTKIAIVKVQARLDHDAGMVALAKAKYPSAITASRSGGDERSLTIDGGAWGVAITPKAVVVRLNRRNLLGCPDGSSRFVGVALALP